MKLKPFQFCALLALLSCMLASCGTTGDAMNPTIGEMDRLDVKWGLPPRQSKGTSRKPLPSADRMNMPSASAPAPALAPIPEQAPAPAATAPAPAPAPITVDPSKINLR